MEGSSLDGVPVLCIDLGKTSVRFLVLDSDSDPDEQAHVATGHPGAAHGDGEGLLDRLLDEVRGLPLPAYRAVGVGAAGTLTAPDAARRIAAGLRAGLGMPVAVTSDIITAHAGALAGAAGVALIAGTGAVALGVSPTGTVRRIDGWGPNVGDLGGGSWIGREGLRAALFARATGMATRLTARVRDLGGTEGDPVAAVSASDNPARVLASFAPAVLEEAAAGDAVASGILARAVAHLADSAEAAAFFGPAPVALLGGLTEHASFRSALEAALTQRALTPAAIQGSALDGARRIALRHDLPFEEFIHRA